MAAIEHQGTIRFCAYDAGHLARDRPLTRAADLGGLSPESLDVLIKEILPVPSVDGKSKIVVNFGLEGLWLSIALLAENNN